MKSNKGEQVFSEKTDEILAGKIIEHSEINSKKTFDDNKTASPSAVRSRQSVLKHLPLIVVILTSILLCVLLVERNMQKQDT